MYSKMSFIFLINLSIALWIWFPGSIYQFMKISTINNTIVVSQCIVIARSKTHNNKLILLSVSGGIILALL